MGQAALVVGLVASITVMSAQSEQLWVSVFEGTSRAGLVPVAEPYATAGPWAAIPSRAAADSVPPSASDFRIRTWMENGNARVLVFAVWSEPIADRTIERENQIATFVLAAGHSREVTEAERYGAVPFTVSAVRR
jgi:hypothetical protein